jgi:hypothetical protein
MAACKGTIHSSGSPSRTEAKIIFKTINLDKKACALMHDSQILFLPAYLCRTEPMQAP